MATLTQTTQTVVDGIDEEGNIHVKEITKIFIDGQPTEYKSFARRVVHVGDDIEKENPKVQVAATAMWDDAKLASKVAKTIAKVATKRAEIEASVAELQTAINTEKAKKEELKVVQETPVV